MDRYTHDTKNWLDQRFKKTDEQGIYFAHQPIYGFRKEHSESGAIVRYIITYQIMKGLSYLKFSSLLDVGGAEGYKAALAHKIFNVYVRSVDLSEEACTRAKEIYGIDGEQVDIHKLPYNDNEFDVVLCSETLEHVPNIQEATIELIRVCSKAVIITVPHESKKTIENNIKEKIPHGHIHSLDTDSFDFVLPEVSKIISRRFHNPFMKKITAIADAVKREKIKNSPHFIVATYNFLVPMFRIIFSKPSVSILINIDDFISNLIQSYSGMIFIILKDSSCYSLHRKKHFNISQIINFKVPYHYIKSKKHYN